MRSEATNGRALAAQLERLRSYHREHSHLGKRYAEAIREFVPGYRPRTAAELASLSRTMGLLTLT